MRQLNLKTLAAVMKLMRKHGVTEFQAEEFSLKVPVQEKRQRKPARKPKAVAAVETEQAFLDQHTLPPVDDEPWNAIGDEAINRFSVTGKL